MFQKIIERIAAAIVELSSELQSDASISEQERGLHAQHLLQILTVAHATPPPKAEDETEVVLTGSPEIEPTPPRSIDQLPSLKPVKTRKSGSGREFRFTDTEVLSALERFDGSVDRTAAFLKCARNTVYRVRARSQGTAPVIWNAANRAKLAELVSKVPRPSLEEIASEMGTSTSAIQTAMSRHGFTKNNGKNVESLKQRACLNCRNPFMSTHAGNRRCPRCISTDSEIAA